MRTFRIVLVLACVGTSQVVSASPLELYGFGSRSSAMAGAGVATCTSFDCVFLNPGRLARQRRKTLSAGYSYGDLNLTINEKKSNSENTQATTFGVVVPLKLGASLADRVTLGLGMMVPRNAIARARSPEVGTPSFALLDSRSEIVGIQLALGYAWNEHVGFGVGVLVSGTLAGRILVDVDGAGRFITRSEQELKSNFTPVLGASLESSDKVGAVARRRYGISVRGAAEAGYDIQIDNNLAAHLPLSLPQLLVVGAPQYDPASIILEFGYQATPELGLEFQLDYKRWSAFPLPTENPIERGDDLAGADFHDTVVPRMAVEWLSGPVGAQFALRAGYSFIYSPAPEMTGQASLLDNHRHVGSAGLGISWPEASHGLRIEMWVQEHRLLDRNHEKTDPASELGIIRSEGNIHIGGMSVGVDL
ncbi:MAG: outer membrane protein transport protein [Kofleriaceae bacterium]|nr:outer membrane protein transport protein [Kofleriaceae bacterium]